MRGSWRRSSAPSRRRARRRCRRPMVGEPDFLRERGAAGSIAPTAATSAVRKRERDDCIEDSDQGLGRNERPNVAPAPTRRRLATRGLPAAAAPTAASPAGERARACCGSARARGLEAKGPGVRLPGQQRLDVAEILVRRRIARVEADRFLELGARLAVLAARGIDRGEVVVRLGELGVVLHELLQDRLRLARTAAVGEENRFQESHLRILRIGGEHAVGAFERGGCLAGVVQPRGFREVLGGRAPPHRGRRALRRAATR